MTDIPAFNGQWDQLDAYLRQLTREHGQVFMLATLRRHLRRTPHQQPIDTPARVPVTRIATGTKTKVDSQSRRRQR